MKRNILALLLIFCLLLIVPLNSYKISVKANPKTWTVSGDPERPANFTTIQEAINSPLVVDGDIIYVYNWTYHENIVVNKTISLIGENQDSTIIDGGKKDNVIYVNVPQVDINGFTIQLSADSPKSGIILDHSVNSNISYNKIINCGAGISLYYSSNNTIATNFIRFCYVGIHLFGSTNNVLLNNNVVESFYGVELRYSDENIISKTVLSSNFYEIYLFSSSKNIISKNTISNCLINGAGMYITFYSINNTIFNNNFFNNTENVQTDEDLANIWSYEEEGNYWSEYVGQDTNGDGIGDFPYVINLYNQDNYPLMGMFSDFSVYYMEIYYSVTIISNSTISAFKFEANNETGNKILSFDVSGEDGLEGFCRIKIPRDLMEYPLIVLVDSSEAASKILALNETYVCLYFQHPLNSQVTIISSRTASLYYELLEKYLTLNESFYSLNASFYVIMNEFLELQSDFDDLNKTYSILLSNYTELQEQFFGLNETYVQLLGNFSMLQLELDTLNQIYGNLVANYTQLQRDLEALNEVYSKLQGNYSLLLSDYTQLQISLQMFSNLNATYYTLLNSYNLLLENYSKLQESFDALNSSYAEHLLEFSSQAQNTRNLVYIFIAMTAIFIIVVVYLSKRAHSTMLGKTKIFEEKGKEQS